MNKPHNLQLQDNQKSTWLGYFHTIKTCLEANLSHASFSPPLYISGEISKDALECLICSGCWRIPLTGHNFPIIDYLYTVFLGV